jgi:hypothetical protein
VVISCGSVSCPYTQQVSRPRNLTFLNDDLASIATAKIKTVNKKKKTKKKWKEEERRQKEAWIRGKHDKRRKKKKE